MTTPSDASSRPERSLVFNVGEWQVMVGDQRFPGLLHCDDRPGGRARRKSWKTVAIPRLDDNERQRRAAYSKLDWSPTEAST
jgi:hypothetical protein